MVVGVPLDFEEEIVGEAVRRIPTVQNVHLFVFPIPQQFPLQTIVLNVINRFKVSYSTNNHKAMNN